MRPLITHEELIKLVHYDPETGVFTSLRTGERRGCAHPHTGYWVITLNKRQYMAGRLAWLYVHGDWPVNHIDHINGIKTDNRIVNLRDVTHAQNMLNKKQYRQNTSGVSGVYWAKHTNRWGARIARGRRHIFLGYFADFDKAAAVRRAAEVELYGEFSRNHRFAAGPRAGVGK
jgi:hypothetical protein